MRKHRIIERLLTDFMGYTAAEAHVHADELGDTFTDEMVERIDEKLGHPERCPHGWPVDPDFEQAENRELEPLSALEPGSSATIVRLAEHDGDLLHWFYDEGLAPGTTIELRAAEPAAGQFRVAVDGVEKAIGDKAAAGLFVRRASAALSARRAADASDSCQTESDHAPRRAGRAKHARFTVATQSRAPADGSHVWGGGHRSQFVHLHVSDRV